jgi:CyaY protein
MDSPLTDAQFDVLTREVLASIESTVDRWLQEDVIDIDTQRTGGLLELVFPDASKIVVNTQPPLHELWIAGKAGGQHFRHQAGRWVDTREGVDFFDALSRQASQHAGRALEFARR